MRHCSALPRSPSGSPSAPALTTALVDPSRITLVIALAYLSIMLAVGTLISYFSTRRSRTGRVGARRLRALVSLARGPLFPAAGRDVDYAYVKATAKAHLDLRRRVRVLHVVGAPRREARPRPPRDGGALPETRRPRLGRSHRRGVRSGGVGCLAGRQTLPWRRGDQRFSGGRHGDSAATPPVRPARDSAARRPRLRVHRRHPRQTPWRQALLQPTPRGVPVSYPEPRPSRSSSW